VEGLVFKA